MRDQIDAARIAQRVVDELAGDAEAIGRRAAAKIRAACKTEPEREVTDALRLVIEGYIEAEILTTVRERLAALGSPVEEGDVVIRLGYAEAVQAVTAIVEAMDPERPATELETLSELREKFYRELGLSD